MTWAQLISKYIHYIIIGMLVFGILLVAELPFSFWMPFWEDLPEWMQEHSLITLLIPIFPFALISGLALGTVLFFVKEL